jgi:hypothetical protein
MPIRRQGAGRIALFLKCNTEAQAGLGEVRIGSQRGPKRGDGLGKPARLQAEKS